MTGRPAAGPAEAGGPGADGSSSAGSSGTGPSGTGPSSGSPSGGSREGGPGEVAAIRPDGWDGYRFWLIVRNAGWLAALSLALVAALGVALALAGPLGLVVAADLLALLALARVLARIPRRAVAEGQPPQLPAHRVDQAGHGRAGRARAALRRLTPGRPDPSPVAAADFPAFLRINSDLGWAQVSWWHYDHGTRRLLARLLGMVLMEGQRLDLAADPHRARELAGEELWPLVDPARPTSQDTHTHGPGLDTLARLTDLLEHL